MAPKKLAWALIALAFLSKVSFAFTGLVPDSVPLFVFQGGIHPYVNVALNLFLGFCLFLTLRARREMPRLGDFRAPYVVFAVGTVVLLWVQHFLQMATDTVDAAAYLVVITMLCTTFLVWVFGLVVPKLIPARELVEGVGLICAVICVVSILLHFAGFPALWKGSRFVGVLKHIPYMVTAATVGYLFGLARFNLSRGIRHTALWALLQLACLYALWLTGTRSAVFAVLLGSFLWFVTVQPPTPSFRLARFLLVWLTVVGAALFGTFAYEFSRDLLTGKTAIGSRQPQDGVSDRMDEVYRGLDMLEKAPWIGLGLLSKFGDTEGEDVVNSYNSFQDPHNLFISSAVVGGYPFGVWVAFGYLIALAACIQAVFRSEFPTHLLGIYLLSHLPILAIYHMHLSLGGLADRLYWLVFGYLGLKWAKLPHKDSVRI
jgi:O-antigen ligase